MLSVFHADRRCTSLPAAPGVTVSLLLLTSLITTQAPAALAGAKPNPTLGPQQTLVSVINFLDNASNPPFTIEQVRDRVFGTVSDYFFEASYEQTWLTGDVVGWLTLPMASTCATGEIKAAADAAAAQQGFDLSAYGRFVYVFDSEVQCGWSGFSTITAYPSSSFLKGFQDADIFGHELGHAFGLHHADIVRCSDGVMTGECTYDTGERFDVMGGSAETTEPKHFSAPNKERLGWLDPDDIVTVTSAGIYSIEPLEAPGGGHPKALKILKEVDPLTGVRYWYYIEYRQAIGFDTQLEAYPNVMNGVLLRYAVAPEDLYSHLGDTLLSTRLLDLNPNSHYFMSDNLSDPALEVGQTFTDPQSGLTLTTLWADGATAGVQVEFAAGKCLDSAPVLALTHSPDTGVQVGTPVGYAMTLENRSSPDCDASTFSFGANVPAGWLAAFEPENLLVEPGASAAVQLTVTSTADAASGEYTLPVTAAPVEHPDLTASTDLTYRILDATGNRLPVAVDDEASVRPGESVTIPVLANDSDPDGDTLAVVGISQGREGSVTLNRDGTVTYQSAPRQKHSDRFSYVVSDGTGQSSAEVIVAIIKGKGSKNR